MATSKKVIEVTGDSVNPTLLTAFAGIVKGSLSGERKAWLEGVELLAKNIVTVRGLQETIKANTEENGSLPTLTTSSVQYWARMKMLADLEGGDTFTVKELEKLARDLSAKHGKKFAEVIQGAKIAKLRKDTKGHNSTRQPSTATDTKVTDSKGKKQTPEEVAKALTALILKGNAKISIATANALWEALSDMVAVAELEEEAA